MLSANDRIRLRGMTLLSPAELQTLEAVCDTLLPSIPPSSSQRGLGSEPSDLGGLLTRSASDVDVAGLLLAALALEPAETVTRFRQLLRLMGSPMFGLALAGRPRGFAQLAPRLRERALLRMAESPLPFLRQAFQALKRPVTFIFYAAPAGAQNPNWTAIGYTA